MLMTKYEIATWITTVEALSMIKQSASDGTIPGYLLRSVLHAMHRHARGKHFFFPLVLFTSFYCSED